MLFSIPFFDPIAKWRHPAGYESLMGAIRSGNLQSVRDLLESGVNPNNFPNSPRDQELEDDITPLHYAIQNGNIKTIKLLLVYGADPNLGDGWAQTTLEAADSNIQIIDLLKQYGARDSNSVTSTSFPKIRIKTQQPGISMIR